jgi:hypothetical protein
VTTENFSRSIVEAKSFTFGGGKTHENACRAESALEGMSIAERLLKFIQFLGRT